MADKAKFVGTGRLLVMLAALVPLTVRAQAPAPNEVQTHHFDKVCRLDGVLYDVDIRRSQRDLFVGTPEKHETQPFRILELFSRPSESSGSTGKRLWWMVSLAGMKGVVEGGPVFSVCSAERNGKPVVVLAMANSYYASTTVFLIDPAHEISELPDRISTAETDKRAGSAGRLVAESQIERIDVPSELRRKMYGTRAIHADAVDGGVVLRMERADKSVVRLQFEFEKNAWHKVLGD